MTNRLHDLEAILSLTEFMLGKARAGEWDDVPALERERRACLEAVLAEPVTPEQAGAFRSRLERILELDGELTALAVALRDESAAQLQQIRQGERARAAYAGGR